MDIICSLCFRYNLVLSDVAIYRQSGVFNIVLAHTFVNLTIDSCNGDILKTNLA